MPYENILVETRDRVSLVVLNCPKVLNALNDAFMDELGAALLTLDTGANIGAIVITGSEKTFAAGADIDAMADYDFATVYKNEYITCNWGITHRIRKSVIAAMTGYVLGGSCKLTIMCDIIPAVDTAKFGQPEIKLSTMSGAGGTQRLSRVVSKAKTMDLCLTVRMVGAEEAERAGLVSRAVPAGKLLDKAIQAAETIAGFSLPMVMMIRESVDAAYETSLSKGVHLERRLFHSMFTIGNQKGDMRAFIEKRAPALKHQ